MVRYFRRVTIIKIRKPQTTDINEEIQWFSDSLGLFSERDKEKSKYRIFLELLKASKQKKALSSDEIASKSDLSRATVIHHLNSLMEKGLIETDRNRYFLRVSNLEQLIRLIKEEMESTLEDLRKVAKELDEELNL